MGTSKTKTQKYARDFFEEWVYIWDGTQWLGSESSSFNLVTIQDLVVEGQSS